MFKTFGSMYCFLAKSSLSILSFKMCQNSSRVMSSASGYKCTVNPKSPVCSWNEWDPLEEIIVGISDEATVPHLSVEVKACVNPNQVSFFEKNGGKLWADSIPRDHWVKLEDNVKNLVRVLEAEGVKVERPEAMNFRMEYVTPMFKSTGFYAAMPRDILLIVGDEIIEATMTWKSRYFEYICYRPLINKYSRAGAKWTAAPKPLCGPDLIDESYEVKDEDQRNKLMNNLQYVTTECEPCFDAADFIRAGKDIFAQRSQVTNMAGIQWVQKQIASKGIKVHVLHFKDGRPMHIDATFSLVKPGLAFQNPDRPCQEADILRAAGWKIVDAPIPQIKHDHPLWLGSKWLCMNTLMLDEHRVLVEKEETDLQDLYRSNGVTPIPITMRHANSIGGGFHCWTSDVRRKGILQSYFDWTNGEIPLRAT